MSYKISEIQVEYPVQRLEKKFVLLKKKNGAHRL